MTTERIRKDIRSIDKILAYLCGSGESPSEIVEPILELFRARAGSWESEAEESSRLMRYEEEREQQKQKSLYFRLFRKKRRKIENDEDEFASRHLKTGGRGYLLCAEPFYLSAKAVSRTYQEACAVLRGTKKLEDWRREVEEDDEQVWDQLGYDRPYDSLFVLLEERAKEESSSK